MGVVQSADANNGSMIESIWREPSYSRSSISIDINSGIVQSTCPRLIRLTGALFPPKNTKQTFFVRRNPFTFIGIITAPQPTAQRGTKQSEYIHCFGRLINNKGNQDIHGSCQRRPTIFNVIWYRNTTFEMWPTMRTQIYVLLLWNVIDKFVLNDELW